MFYENRGKVNTVIHHIILSSSYSAHTRIALDFPFGKEIDYGTVNPVMDRIQESFGGPTVQVGVHVIQTSSYDWESVVLKDPYFKGIRVMDSAEEFIELVRKDMFLSGMDVAKYILATEPCTHARVNMLTYLCYADYMHDTGRRMFTDDILDLECGPVVDTILRDMEKYWKEHGTGRTTDLDSDTHHLDDTHELGITRDRMAARSRIIFAAYGYDMIYSIDRTLETYGNLPNSELMAAIKGPPRPNIITSDV